MSSLQTHMCGAGVDILFGFHKPGAWNSINDFVEGCGWISKENTAPKMAGR